MYDVAALGELLIDFTESGKSEQGNQLLEVNPGGAPCNVLAMLNNLGKKVAFIGKVGQDMFGTLLKHTLDEVGICSKSLRMDRKCGLHWHLCIRCRMGTGSFFLSEPRSRYDAEGRRGGSRTDPKYKNLSLWNTLYDT